MSPAAVASVLDSALLGERVAVSQRSIDRFAKAHDASHYLFVPEAVVTPHDADAVASVFAAARAAGRSVTFRSGGTSLSGQGVTDELLVDTRARFRGIRVGEEGRTVRVEPGATVRQVNQRLARHGRKLGPDPASEIACTIGGVIANNSSGMACGITQNAYRTIASLRLVLPSGTVLDTGAPDAAELLAAREPELHAGLLRLRERLLASPASVERVRQQFSMKNTMGYGLNALLDFAEPLRILEHLVIGSEGTLAFVAEAVFDTVPLLPHAATALLVLPSLREATAALPELVATGAATIELMDATSLLVAQRAADVPAQIAALAIDGHTALLVEYQAETADALDAALAGAAPLLDALPLAAPAAFTRDAAQRAALWHVRKGLYTTVAGARPSGTTALLEDIVVPVEHLLPTCERLIGLFAEHGYDDSVIFGHAKDGNLHFMLGERFDDPEQLARYERFTEDLVQLVLEQGGSLKAEHGTGRIMAPFVRRQYGDELYAIMREVKRLFDPSGLLNPGVVLSDDPDSYLRHLKLVPTVEAEVDRCVECGYCEPSCPSKDLTLTPRQRIALRRDIASAEAAGDTALAAELRDDYEYDGEQTCAVDGLCAIACPVDINTGDLVRRLRAERRSPVLNAGWSAAAAAWGPVTRLGGAALTVANALPAALPKAATTVGRALLGRDTVPEYDGGLPRGGAKRPEPGGDPATAEAVFFAACIGTMFGPEPGGIGATAALLELAGRAGVGLVVPEGIGSLCCGTPWKSKGFLDGYRSMTERVLPALLAASDGGRLPIVCDAASCTEGLETMQHLAAVAGREAPALRFVDATQFAADRILPRLEVTAPVGRVAVHHTCSTTALGAGGAIDRIAHALAAEVVLPDDWSCCAFAGDRGLLHPELSASATAREAAEVIAADADWHVSANRTCEIGMTRATGRPYRHLLELLEAATRP
ncbi:FAD-binding and (Fe-S)-binding domain-containing protein [Agromyces mediolanus]|uniref:D-lactate dehydrogenase (cytochrome) n=1 Tax=Agromyces mediolanus TaxID=41986 RepID=A0A918CD70_AGRME|nr:FAD-binding and (Fe-S)-binding domain-containing protein [Agromyces mediolanus]GGR17068.1 oxidoreductase [Agromyces mediolanus]GLJ71660.1 oxidoreductase [Agromyces mediolanus]